MDAKAETAMHGDLRKGPGKELFDALKKVILHALPTSPSISVLQRSASM